MRQMQTRRRRRIGLLSIMALMLVGSLSVGTVHAYLTYLHKTLENNFTIALDSTSTVIEKYPTYEDIEDPPWKYPDLRETVASYEKLIQIGNTGYLDEYVRVRLDFSEKDIEEKTTFSHDGENYYPVAEYKDHLPEGWVYNETDGYYYYTPIVYAGDWEEVSKNLNYAPELGEYFYKPDDELILRDPCVTTPLVQYMKTTFDSPIDIRSYHVNISEDSVPFYFGNDYASAWDNYLAGR